MTCVLTAAGLDCEQIFARIRARTASPKLRVLAKLLKECLPKDSVVADYMCVIQRICESGPDFLHFVAQLCLCMGLAIEAAHSEPAFVGKPSLGSGPDSKLSITFPDIEGMAEEEYGGIDRACYMYVENAKDGAVGVRSYSASGDGGYCGLSIHHSVISLPSGIGYIGVPQVSPPSFSFA